MCFVLFCCKRLLLTFDVVVYNRTLMQIKVTHRVAILLSTGPAVCTTPRSSKPRDSATSTTL